MPYYTNFDSRGPDRVRLNRPTTFDASARATPRSRFQRSQHSRPTTRDSIGSRVSMTSREGDITQRGESLTAQAKRVLHGDSAMSHRSNMITPMTPMRNGGDGPYAKWPTDPPEERLGSPPLQIPDALLSYTFERGAASTLRKVRDSYAGRHVFKGQGLHPMVAGLEPSGWRSAYQELVEQPALAHGVGKSEYQAQVVYTKEPSFYDVKFATRSQMRRAARTAPPAQRSSRQHKWSPGAVLPQLQ